MQVQPLAVHITCLFQEEKGLAMEWSGKTALVTGGGSGIGKQLCMTLAQKGCKITVSEIACSLIAC